MVFREVFFIVIKFRGCGRLVCLIIWFVLVMIFFLIGVFLGGNYLIVIVLNDWCFLYVNVLLFCGFGNENNVILLSVVFYWNNEDFVKW